MKTAMKHMRKLLVASLMLAAAATSYAADSQAPAPARQQHELVAKQPQIRVAASRLEVSVPSDETVHVAVYAITGQLVKQFQVSGSVSVDLPAGYYIVKCGNITQRVVIK